MTKLIPESLQEIVSVLSWMYREFIDEKAKRYYKAIVLWIFLAKITEVLAPWCLGLMAAAIASPTESPNKAFFGFVLANSAKAYVDWRASRARELFLGQAFRGLDGGMNKRFFEKDLGTHLEEHNILSKSAMEKGRQRADTLVHLATFWVADSLLVLVITIPVLAYINPAVCGIVVLGILVSVAFSFITNRQVLKNSEPVEEEFRQILNDRDDRWEAIERVMTTATEDDEVRTIDARYGVMLSHDRPVWLRFIDMSALRNSITTIALLCVVWITAKSADQNAMPVGTFISIATWVTIAIAQAHNLANLERQITWSIPPLRSMRTALSLPRKVLDRENAVVLEPNGPATVEFRNVGHTFRDGEPVLRDISFTVRAGEKVAIIGASGSGKSTLGKLLLRYMDPSAGDIFVNGYNLRDVAQKSWRRIAVPVRQGPQILDGTLKENLLYGMKAEERALMSDDELWTFMKRFRIDFGNRLTEGLETKVGKGGVKLSGGEAQRVMIGAAALRKPRLMIIDEATSALDAESQEAVQDALYELLEQGCSAIIIAHRLSTIARCDRIVMLQSARQNPDGPQIEAIAESMEELAKLSPTFRGLAVKEGVLVGTE